MLIHVYNVQCCQYAMLVYQCSGDETAHLAETLTIDETLSIGILTFLSSVDSNDSDNVVSWSSIMVSLGTDDVVRPISHIIRQHPTQKGRSDNNKRGEYLLDHLLHWIIENKKIGHPLHLLVISTICVCNCKV